MGFRSSLGKKFYFKNKNFKKMQKNSFWNSLNIKKNLTESPHCAYLLTFSLFIFVYLFSIWTFLWQSKKTWLFSQRHWTNRAFRLLCVFSLSFSPIQNGSCTICKLYVNSFLFIYECHTNHEFKQSFCPRISASRCRYTLCPLSALQTKIIFSFSCSVYLMTFLCFVSERKVIVRIWDAIVYLFAYIVELLLHHPLPSNSIRCCWSFCSSNVYLFPFGNFSAVFSPFGQQLMYRVVL